jgi:hypothetical protein|tara:strand:+ start:1017 stop:1316 length:300 start_codon:yes stop_codon:yes gene_type:complete
MSSIWSVRGVPPHLRRNIVKAASLAGVSVAEWLELAVSPALETDSPARTPSGQPKFLKKTTGQDNLSQRRSDELLTAIDNCLADLEGLTEVYDKPAQSH